MSPEDRVEQARAAHRKVWTCEPMSRVPFDAQRMRDAAAAAAWNDGGQDLGKVIT